MFVSHCIVYMRPEGVTINVDKVRLRLHLKESEAGPTLVATSPRDRANLAAQLRARPDLMTIIRHLVSLADTPAEEAPTLRVELNDSADGDGT